MTQAFNLSQFANKLNSSGQTDNTGLQNSSVTVTAGTGMSGGGAVALGSSVTLTNAGVTSIIAGSNISVSSSTGAVTISSSGGVTSLNGQTGAITNTSLYAIGSYINGRPANTTVYNIDSTISGSSLYSLPTGTIYSGTEFQAPGIGSITTPSAVGVGTWRATATTAVGNGNGSSVLWVRIS
jgi:hypothetical protein